MSLINPSALLLAALAAPIIVFYILKIRLRRVPVSTLMFWQQIFEEKKPRSIWQRLRHLLSLFLQLAFLLLLVFALADPIFRWQQARARRVVLVVDNSASMNASDVKPSRLAAAKAEGLRLIDGMRLGDELAIIAAEAQPRVACGPTDHQRTLRTALESIEACDGPTRVNHAVSLARRLLSGSEKVRRVVVLTDGSFDEAAELARQDDVDLIKLGTNADNVGITRLQARRSLLDPIGYEILVEVCNASDQAASFRLELELDGDPIDVVPLTLTAGERTVQVFEKTSGDGGKLRAHVDRVDSLPADNTAWAILPRRSRQKVTLITPGNLFLEKVFEAIPLVDLKVHKTGADGQGAAPKPTEASAGSITVFHRQVPDVLPAGHVLVIEPDRSGPLWDLGEPLHNPIVAKQDKDSPLMRHIRLDNVVVPEARKLTLKRPAQILAESAQGDPLYALVDRPEGSASGHGKVVVLTVDLEKSDLPLQTAFPIMMTNLLNWFGGTKGELREALPAGAVADVELPIEKPGASERILVAPDGRERALNVPSGATKATIGPLDHAGVWSVVRRPVHDRKTRDTGTRPTEPAEIVTDLACNLADRRESDLRPAPGIADRPASLASGLGGLLVRPIWYYLLASAWLLTSWEWFLYQRRWID
jgi:von Willebrand factor type A domain/Aerotolerance regulator N-terminal